MTTLIEPSKSLGYSPIYLDLVAGLDSATRFYVSRDIEHVASQLDRRDYHRDRIADILLRQNRIFGSSQKALSHIERLRDQRAVCVISGQQAVLFGGPMLVMTKIMAVVKAADSYEQHLKRPVIPMFWIAGDDHDFEEANHAWLLDRSAEPVKLQYSTPPTTRLSTSEIYFEDSVELVRVKEQLAEVMGTTDFTDDLYRLVDGAYGTGETFVSAFGKLMARLTADLGVVFFSPGDAEAKELARPLFYEILLKQDAMHDTLKSTNKAILQRGYHTQVEKKDDATHLFVNRNGRKAVMHEGDGFAIGDDRISLDELKRIIDEEPASVSPDVMTRPILQSYLFPVVSQKGGPAEIAYLAQINPLFDLFDVVPPYHCPRPSATFVEKRYEQLMDDYGISHQDVTGDIEQVINRVLARTFPKDLEHDFEALRSDVEDHFERFIAESLQFDPSLQKFAKQTFGKVDFALKAFEGKVFTSHKKKSQQTRDRIYRLWHTLYANRALQERSVNVIYFLSRYGMPFLSFAYDSLDHEETAHQLIMLSEMDG